jgi:excisionase family DNA binding protein
VLSRACLISEAAELLGCSVATVRRRIATGVLPVIKHGRILRLLEADLHEFIRNSRKWR